MLAHLAPQVKICGLTRPEDVAHAIEYGADFLGFIVETESKRRLSLSEATALALPACGVIPRVAVTVNADKALLERICTDMQPDYIQCHGDETPKHVRDIAMRYNVKTIKAIAVRTAHDIKAAQAYTDAADILLYDAKPPEGHTIRGGHGKAFNWALLQHVRHNHDWALAGGLDPNTIRRAIKQTAAPIVDVSSGVEAKAGIKDSSLIKAFMKAAKYG